MSILKWIPALGAVLLGCGGAGGPGAVTPSVPDGAPAGFVRTYGGAGDEFVDKVAALQDGGWVACGRFDGSASFGAATVLESAGEGDIFVARHDPAGRLIWAIRGGGAGNLDVVRAVAVFADGSILVVGEIEGDATFVAPTGEELFFDYTDPPSQDEGRLFAIRVNEDGAIPWGFAPPGRNSDATAAVVLPDQSFAIAGNFGSSLVLGIGPAETTLDGPAPFLAHYAETGDLLAAFVGDGVVSDMATGAPGELLVAGTFSGTLVLDGTEWATGGAPDMYVASFGIDGTVDWARSLGAAAGPRAAWVAGFPDGSAVATGRSDGMVVIGAGEPNEATVGGAIVAGLDSEGLLRWARGTAGQGSDTPHGVLALPDRSAVVVGRKSGDFVVGPGAPDAVDLGFGIGPFLLRFDEAGGIVWARTDGVAGPLDVPNGFNDVALWRGSLLVGSEFAFQATYGANGPFATFVLAVERSLDAVALRYSVCAGLLEEDVATKN